MKISGLDHREDSEQTTTWVPPAVSLRVKMRLTEREKERRGISSIEDDEVEGESVYVCLLVHGDGVEKRVNEISPFGALNRFLLEKNTSKKIQDAYFSQC